LTRELLVATTSEGKLREIREALRSVDVEVASLADVGWGDEIPEAGETFETNATQKAEAVCRALGRPALADDSGLEVEALGGAPGVYSTRFAGPDTTEEDRNRELVHLLRGTGLPPPWPARYRCVLALAVPGRATELFEGECPGAIVPEARGTGGFGYDPIFLLPERGVTVGEITLAEKQTVSHRGKALRKLAARLRELARETPLA
jgi:XTP/dITP diphosphohydrolase